jgi:hypothetical protein
MVTEDKMIKIFQIYVSAELENRIIKLEARLEGIGATDKEIEELRQDGYLTNKLPLFKSTKGTNVGNEVYNLKIQPKAKYFLRDRGLPTVCD